MSDLSREFQVKIAGIPADLQLLIAPLSRDRFKATAVTMFGTRSVEISREQIRELHGLCNAALCTDGPQDPEG